jgi:hypothetical protein
MIGTRTINRYESDYKQKMTEKTRKQKFETIYAIKNREAFAEDPKALIGFMMDLGFESVDINMVRYLCKADVEAISETIAGNLELKEKLGQMAAKTRLDKNKLESLLKDMAP